MLYFSSLLLCTLLFFVVHGYLYSRSDQVAEIYSKEGHVDTEEAPWYPNEAFGSYCPEGTWAIGIQFKSQGDQGLTGDDTSGNGLRLKCSSATNWNSNTNTIETPSPKSWGSWNAKQCPTSHTFLSSFKTQVESDQGIWDDTTLNCAEFQCSDSITIKPTNCRTAGTWGPWGSCPSGSYICGLTEQFEPPETTDDETGLNAVRFYCCGFTAAPTTSIPTRSPTEIPTVSPTDMPTTRSPTETPTSTVTSDESVISTLIPTAPPVDGGKYADHEGESSNELLIILIGIVSGLVCLVILGGVFYVLCLRKMVKEVRGANNVAVSEQSRQSGTQLDIVTAVGDSTNTKNGSVANTEGGYGRVTQLDDEDDCVP